MATFVLVHGGGHGGWCYTRVARLLREAGHLVYAPSLTGLADRKHLLSRDTDLDTHVTDIVNLLDYEELSDVVLVGHSYGGMVITGVADRAGRRIARLVYLDAAHPKDGESLADVAPAMMSMAQGELFVADGVELVMSPESQVIPHLGVTDPADFAWMKSKLTPHPWKCFTQKLQFRDEVALRRIPRTSINCTQALRSSVPDARERQLDGDQLFEIDTGHDLMITEPAAVADMLLQAAAAGSRAASQPASERV
ncbi:alpha/beta hydrolase [Phenylobacterium sp. LjRoot225]|uniref:alpha/beta fold hydrolase n=1 Tax=Phenylobacterium sp. LjRoot225 TaxID=3342285 RepID=UPI003ECF7BE1